MRAEGRRLRAWGHGATATVVSKNRTLVVRFCLRRSQDSKPDQEEAPMPSPDRRPALYASYCHAAQIVDTVAPGDLAKPTPCPAYAVSDLVDHLVGAGRRASALGRGEVPTADAFSHVQLTDAAPVLIRSGSEAESAWSDDQRLGATVAMPWGETYTGAVVVDMYLAELTAHTWDLAFAIGQVGRLEPSLAEPALEGARAMMKPEYRNQLGEGNPYASEVPAPDGATSWDCLAAFMGRNPRAALPV
jgi:uncharacterized protein (TIGR03086 family)